MGTLFAVDVQNRSGWLKFEEHMSLAQLTVLKLGIALFICTAAGFRHLSNINEEQLRNCERYAPITIAIFSTILLEEIIEDLCRVSTRC